MTTTATTAIQRAIERQHAFGRSVGRSHTPTTQTIHSHSISQQMMESCSTILHKCACVCAHIHSHMKKKVSALCTCTHYTDTYIAEHSFNLCIELDGLRVHISFILNLYIYRTHMIRVDGNRQTDRYTHTQRKRMKKIYRTTYTFNWYKHMKKQQS